MMTKLPKGGAKRTGSCSGLVDYLEKEQAGQWISQDREGIAGHEVIASIDANKRDLGKDDDKYYQLVISPSQKELNHIGHDPAKLTAFVRAAMEAYAHNFGKGLTSKDLVWFGKIEHERSHTHQERAVQLGEIAKGTPKEGDQTHIHIIVSRLENLGQYNAKKRAGELAINEQGKPRRAYKLSPLTNHQNTHQGAVKGGFGRNQFSLAVEKQFDHQFAYERSLSESFHYLHTMKYGSEQDKQKLQQDKPVTPSQSLVGFLSDDYLLKIKPISKEGKIQQKASNAVLNEALGKVFQQKEALEREVALKRQLQEQREQREQTQQQSAEVKQKHQPIQWKGPKR